MISVRRKPFIVGVMGSANRDAPCLEDARSLGYEVGKRGYVLLTGGGPGVMEAASEGACNAGGLVVAILPNERKHPLSGYPNRFVDIPVYTGMGDARNAINAKTPDVIVVLDGGPGTLSEMALAVKSKTPVVCLCAPGSVFEFGSGLVRVKNVGEAITEVDRIFKSKEP